LEVGDRAVLPERTIQVQRAQILFLWLHLKAVVTAALLKTVATAVLVVAHIEVIRVVLAHRAKAQMVAREQEAPDIPVAVVVGKVKQVVTQLQQSVEKAAMV
jgi:hypothetical protein